MLTFAKEMGLSAWFEVIFLMAVSALDHAKNNFGQLVMLIETYDCSKG
jgi:hypothetical protein